MSISRLVIRVVLVLILAGMVWIGYRAWQRGQPSYYWDKAQAAAEAGDGQSARIYLQNLLERFPEHDSGHLAIAKLSLEEAKAAKRPATYATNPEALQHLAEAARLRPDDLELQKQLLAAYLAIPRMQEAADVADRVVKSDPGNTDAQFAMLYRAVSAKRDAEAEELIGMLRGQSTPRVFQTLTLSAQHHETTAKADKLQEDLAEASRLAGQLDAKRLSALARSDVHFMPQLLVAGVAKAPDVATADKRAAEALRGLETVVKLQPNRAGELALAACQIMAALEAKHPLAGDAAAAKAAREQLAAQTARLRAAAIEAGDAPPMVYQLTAEAQFAAGQPDDALATIQKGLAAGAKLPAARVKEVLSLRLVAARQLVLLRRFVEAEKHLKVLCANKDSAGLGYLLAGSVSLQEGKLENGLEQFSRAQQSLGNTLPVRVGLASALLGLRRWKDALVHLDALGAASQQATPEQQAWIERHLGSGLNVHFAQLRAHLALGNWREAQRHLAALQGTALEPQALTSAVAFLWQAKNASEALATLAEARKRFPRDRGLVRLEVAILTEQKKTDEAGRVLEQFAAQAPDSLADQLLLADWRINNQRADEARQQLEALEPKAKTPNDKIALTAFRAKALLALGKAEEAAALVEPLRGEPGAATVAGVIAAAAEWKQHDLEGAAEALAQAGKVDPRSSVLSLLQGELAAAQGDYAEAASALAKSLDVTALRGRAETALLTALLTLAQQKSPAEAEAKVDELLRQYPDASSLLFAKADLQFQQGRFDAGMAALDRVARLQPKSAAPAYLKASAWLKANRADRALIEIQRALKLQPANVPALLLAAEASLATQRDALALEYSRAALEKAPKAWEASLVEAAALARLKRTDESLQVLADLVKSQPKLADAHLRLGAAHAAAGRQDKALEIYQQGLKELPGDARLLAAEIGLLVELNRVDEASKVADAAAGPKPDWQKCAELGRAFAAAKQLQAARQWWDRAMTLANDEQKTAVHLLLGNLALLEEQGGGDPQLLAQARDHFAAVVKAQPQNLFAANNLAWLLAAKFDQAQEAVRVAEAARGKAAVEQLPPSFVDTLAVAYRKSGRDDDARRLLEQALAKRPDEAKLLFQLGAVYAGAKREEEARGALERALQLGLPDDKAAEAKALLGKLSQDTPSP